MAPHSSTLTWKIPWMEEPGRLQSMGLLRVGHDWATSLSLFTFMHWRRKWQPIPLFLPGESQGRGAWWAAVYGVAQSRTWLKWLSSSRSSVFSFVRNFHMISCSGCTSLHSHQQHTSILFLPHPLQHLLLLFFLMMAILTGPRWHPLVVFDLHFPDDERCWSSSHMPVGHLYVLLIDLDYSKDRGPMYRPFSMSWSHSLTCPPANSLLSPILCLNIMSFQSLSWPLSGKLNLWILLS